MKNVKKNEPLYTKSLTLVSENLTVEVREKNTWDDGTIQIYHSPRKWKDDNFSIHLAGAKALDEYIEMLMEFRDTYTEEIGKLDG